MKKAILFVFGRLPIKCWPAKHKEALQIARDHILRTEKSVVEFMLEIVTCDHLSSLSFGREDKIARGTQEESGWDPRGKGRKPSHAELQSS